MNYLKKFIKESVNFSNIKTLLIIIAVTIFFSNNNIKYVLLSIIIYILFAFTIWLIVTFNFKKQNKKRLN